MVRKHIWFALHSACRSRLMQQAGRTKPQTSRAAKQGATRSSLMWPCETAKAYSDWCMCASISVQKGHLFLGLITPFHSHQYSSTDFYHHSHTTHCAFLIEFQSTKIKPLTTFSHPAFSFPKLLQAISQPNYQNGKP